MPQTLSLDDVATGFSFSPRPFEPRPKIISRSATHAETIRFLMDEIEMRYCIVPTAALSKKLLKMFEHLTLAEFDDWAERLSGLSVADPEWLGLVDCLTARESYFNRQPELLTVVRRKLLPELIERAGKKPLPVIRILSAGCATGEEAFDLSILLLEALLEAGHATTAEDGAIVVNAPWSIEVIGADLSRQALDIGAAAVYSDHWLGSFRGIHHKMWRFFEEARTPKSNWAPGVRYWQVKQFVKRHVSFQRCNLLAGIPPVTGCDLAVCRNLMLYCDREAKLKVQQMLAGSLQSGSFLLQGELDDQLLPERYLRESDGGVVHYRRR